MLKRFNYKSTMNFNLELETVLHVHLCNISWPAVMLVVKIRQMAPLYEIKLQKPDVNKHTSLDV